MSASDSASWVTVPNVDWYHVIDLPEGPTGPAQWDLRATVSDYLGNVDFKGKRVLEIGPASGYLSFWMERQGAEVVAIETPMDQVWDWIPRPASAERDASRKAFLAHIRRVRNGFWYAHRALNSRVVVHEIGAYNLPSSLGSFDIGLMASVLLHTRSPVGIMESVGNLVTDTMIVADRTHNRWQDQPYALLAPSINNQNNDTWWDFSPLFVQQFLNLMGFTNQRVTTSDQLYLKQNLFLGMSTVVASR